jgi:predicted ATP-dependent Lon-type protease
VIDLLANRVEAELGVAFFVACYSALRKAPVSPALLILGDMSVQGNIKPLRSLTEPLQVAKDNGAKRALIPIENKRNFLDVSADIMEHVDPIFFGDPKTAAMKVAPTSSTSRRSRRHASLRMCGRCFPATACWAGRTVASTGESSWANRRS